MFLMRRVSADERLFIVRSEEPEAFSQPSENRVHAALDKPKQRGRHQRLKTPEKTGAAAARILARHRDRLLRVGATGDDIFQFSNDRSEGFRPSCGCRQALH
jgi:hypothetical protein